MTILNRDIRPDFHEYPRHFKSKIRVGKLADTFFIKNYSMELGAVTTFFEYPFPEIKTLRGSRRFIADIAIWLSYSNWYPKHLINIEIDDFKHNTSKDKFRDETLLIDGLKMKGSYKKGPLLHETWEETMHVPVLRFPGDLKDIDDKTIEAELFKFCRDNQIYLPEAISSNA